MEKYIKPEIEVMDFSAEGIFAGSKDFVVDTGDDNAGDEQFSKKKNIWDTDTWMQE